MRLVAKMRLILHRRPGGILIRTRHLRLAFARTARIGFNQARIHQRAVFEDQAARVQLPVEFGQKLFAQLPLRQHFAKA